MESGTLVIPLKTPQFFGWLAKRMTGGTPHELRATDRTLSSPNWSIDWDDIASISIGTLPMSSRRSLRIAPVRPDALRRRPSKAIDALARLDALAKLPAIQLPETAFHQPLEEIIAQLSRKAARSFS